MVSLIIHAMTWALALLFVPTGRHRAVGRPPVVEDPAISARNTRPAWCGSASSVRAWYGPIEGTAHTLVRPCLRHHEAGLRRKRRRTLLLATYGIDTDTRNIHGLGRGIGAA
jgi:hypothetical protein